MNPDHRQIARSLSDIAHTLESADDAEARVRRTLALLKELLAASRCALLTDRERPVLFTVPEPTPAERAALETKLTSLLARTKEAGDAHPGPPSGRHLALPVIGMDQVVGILYAQPGANSSCDESDLELFAVAAAQLGAYLTTLRLHREAHQLLAVQRETDAVRERLIGIVGHDLRSPLHAISVATQTMLKRGDLSPPDERLAGAVARSAQRMTRMIRELLDFTHARLGGGIPIETGAVDLAQLCRDVIEEQGLADPKRPIRFEANGDTCGRWDGGRLAEVISNLVGNAMKHGAPKTPVEVTLRGDGDEVLLAVHNQGVPIPPRFLTAVFDPFRRGALERESSSLGLGLFISKEIVGAHGGRIEVSSNAADGTTFTVRLPRERGAAS